MRATFVLSFILYVSSFGQFLSFFKDKDQPKNADLLSNRAIQIEAGNAINAMYNFEFERSDLEFRWFQQKYATHPLGSFLLGLNAWWKIVNNTKITKYDDEIIENMDRAIDLAEDMLDDNPKNKEAAFFAAAAYAFKGRLHSERENWTRAAWAGKQAMKYLDKTRGTGDLSPEIIVGDGLYNYYSKWIPENYASLKTLLLFFKKGNKAQGIKQLELVANNAFYTRIEARYFLVQIYAMENDHQKSYNMSRYMHKTFPNNPFFHRFVAREAFVLGKTQEAEKYAEELIQNIEAKKYGYEQVEGRYASYIIGYINHNYQGNIEKAKEYYKKAIDFAIAGGAKDSGYFLGSHLALGKIAQAASDYTAAQYHYKEILDHGDKKSDQYKQAKTLLSETKKLSKKKR